MNDSKLIEITGLWKQETKNGEVYLTGNWGRTKVLVFVNKHKKPDSKEPDYRAFLAPNEPKEKHETAQPKDNFDKF